MSDQKGIPFFTIKSPIFQAPQVPTVDIHDELGELGPWWAETLTKMRQAEVQAEQLIAWSMPITKVIEQNSIRDFQAQGDKYFENLAYSTRKDTVRVRYLDCGGELIMGTVLISPYHHPVLCVDDIVLFYIPREILAKAKGDIIDISANSVRYILDDAGVHKAEP